MKTLPNNLTFKKRTPEFSDENVPHGMLGEHRTASGIWGKIKVFEGRLIYRILEPSIEEHQLDASLDGIVEPQTAHQVEIKEPVKFHVEFYRDSTA